MKQFGIVLLAGMLAISLAACGSKKEEGSLEESSMISTVPPSSSSSTAPSSSSTPSKPAMAGLSIRLGSEVVLRPGDSAVIHVFLEPSTLSREDAANDLELVLDYKIGTVTGPMLGDGSLRFEVSGLSTGNAVATVQTKDGKIKSNPLALNVVAVDPLPGSSAGESGMGALTINLGSDQVLKPGDEVTINVFVESGDINQAADNITLVLDNPQIGTVSGPMISTGKLQYTISGLTSGSATASVVAKDGSVSSNVITIAVATA